MNALNFGGTGGVLHDVQNVVDPGLMANGFGNLAQVPANQNGLNFGGHDGGFGNLAKGPGNQNALNFGVGGGGLHGAQNILDLPSHHAFQESSELRRRPRCRFSLLRFNFPQGNSTVQVITSC
ncbi:hypothetical protein V6N11_027907 [Hibiscus sabdariffa]|uniref:Uncharacterized protein n=1 Tax=Hibiscus sabdariffa TaxID=183260 RepID=A0ABR2NZ64_9ROSI